MSDKSNKLLIALHDISKMLMLAAQMHRQHTSLLITLLEAGTNPTDVIQELRANEEMFCGYLTRIAALSETLRITVGSAEAEAAQ